MPLNFMIILLILFAALLALIIRNIVIHMYVNFVVYV